MGNFILESEGGYRDTAMLEECDKAVRTICKLCNWTQELDQLLKHNERQAGAVSDPRRKSKPIPQAGTTSSKESSTHTATRTTTAFKSTYASKSPRK